MALNTSHGGHGGAGSASGRPMDPGAVGNGTTEWAEMRQTNNKMLNATKWKDVRDDSGYNVNQNLINIVNNTNRVTNGSSVNVSNHMNAFNGQANGTEVWYYAGDNRGYDLAKRLSAAISKALGTFDRGPKATTALYVVNNTVGTTVLIEWCFVDNAGDMAKWRANKDKAIDAALAVLGYKNANVGGGKPVSKPVVYQTKQGWYKALRDDTFYCEKGLERRSRWNIKKGNVIYVDRIEKTGKNGKYTRAKIDSGPHTRYCTLRDDFWKYLGK